MVSSFSCEMQSHHIPFASKGTGNKTKIKKEINIQMIHLSVFGLSFSSVILSPKNEKVNNKFLTRPFKRLPNIHRIFLYSLTLNFLAKAVECVENVFLAGGWCGAGCRSNRCHAAGVRLAAQFGAAHGPQAAEHLLHTHRGSGAGHATVSSRPSCYNIQMYYQIYNYTYHSGKKPYILC